MISIYDFSILPYALGDVLTWNVKQCVRAINAGQTDIQVHLCDLPTNIHQNKYIGEDNCKSHLTDLIPAFYTNPMISSLHIWDKRSEMIECLEFEDSRQHLLKISNSRVMIEANKMLFDEVSDHSEINHFFNKKGSIPNLMIPKGFDLGLDTISRCLERVPEHVIALHLRCRLLDQALGEIEVHRDSNQKVWYEFLKKVKEEFPNVIFVVLGRGKEASNEILSLPNVRFMRPAGWTLAQDLALIPRCTGFMGSCSGFAAMAAFTKRPYLMTKLDERSYKNYGIPFASNKLPFAVDKQFLTTGEETVDTLMRYFQECLSM